jgi:hypothetical protein
VHLALDIRVGAGVDQKPRALGVTVLSGTDQCHVLAELPTHLTLRIAHKKDRR